MTRDLPAVRWAVLVFLMLFALALAGAAVLGAQGSSGAAPGQVLSLLGDPDSGGE
jgi:hypothetical protein